jgi:hypothetical protein
MDYYFIEDTVYITLNNNVIMNFNLDTLRNEEESINKWAKNDNLELNITIDELHFTQSVYCNSEIVTFSLSCNNSMNTLSCHIPKELSVKIFENFFHL